MKEKLTEVLWCNHVPVAAGNIRTESHHIVIYHNKPTHLVIEMGKLKILCESCFMKASQRIV